MLLENVEDPDLRHTVGGENWIVRRSTQGRDMYQALLDFSHSMSVPVTLEATNELLTQVAKVMPDTHARLMRGYQEGALYPLYGHAHHTHVSLLTGEEVQDEIRLNREYIHDVMGAPRPKYPGLFPIEDSLDSSKLQAIRDSGVDFVVFPHLDKRQTRYQADPGLDEKHSPFVIGGGLIALPRHFAVSQYIWRPITKWKADALKPQGYMLGRYWVLPEEYRRRRFVRFPITREEAIAEYSQALRRALAQAPDRGLILYMQDMELMDFGDIALDIMEAAWKKMAAVEEVHINFVTPDDYLDKEVMPRLGGLKRLRFHQVSWAPEIRLVLRYDGHYPPAGAGVFRGRDLSREVFRRWPFIFWEPGRYMATLVNFLLDAFGAGHTVGTDARTLATIDYRFEQLSEEDRIALHGRIIKRACNWGWFPNESLQKRPFLHGYLLSDTLLKRTGTNLQSPGEPPQRCFRGLERILEVIIDTRYDYLSEAIVELATETGKDYRDAFRHLHRAMEWREEARHSILKAQFWAQRLSIPQTGQDNGELRGLLTGFRDYCRAVFISLDRLQRVWASSGDTERLLLKMYDYLFHLYPPRFPGILENTLSEEEIAASKRPLLR